MPVASSVIKQKYNTSFIVEITGNQMIRAIRHVRTGDISS